MSLQTENDITIAPVSFNDQGKLAEFLTQIFAAELYAENSRLAEAGLQAHNVEDELLAADDFYFSTIEMMDCCIVAKKDGKIIGSVCVNPFTSSIQFIAVDANFRRQGIATSLWQEGKKLLLKRGCQEIKIEFRDVPEHEETKSFLAKMGLIMINSITTFSSKL